MVSNTRAFGAVVVTAVVTVAVQTCFEMKRLNNLKPSIEQIVEKEFGKIFDLGWKAALNDRYAVFAANEKFKLLAKN